MPKVQKQPLQGLQDQREYNVYMPCKTALKPIIAKLPRSVFLDHKTKTKVQVCNIFFLHNPHIMEHPLAFSSLNNSKGTNGPD
jgi:hypothetical protein